ncbi:neuroendocrine convertase 2-like [Rhagoletis pomonella]|uniref:neuroendocrine convertase 2-like n=1 Tax=Rhagoletis pomonella TaxID=28610 RepID=UPI001786AEBE|nr:neuroendocrine convertase 2-like [Rhagoletis pomonella]
MDVQGGDSPNYCIRFAGLVESRRDELHTHNVRQGTKVSLHCDYWGDQIMSNLVGGNGNEYHFKHKTLPHARTRRSITHTRLLKSHPLVHTAIQQPGFKRVKRGLRPAIPAIHGLKFDATYSVQPIGVEPTDPYFPLQWYLKNTGQNGGKMRLDLNVQAAWDQGITGKNVTTAIMDDGVDYMHPDLKFNYVSINLYN